MDIIWVTLKRGISIHHLEVLIESVSFENSNNICLDSFDHSSKRQQITALEVIMSYNHDYLI